MGVEGSVGVRVAIAFHALIPASAVKSYSPS